MGSQRRISAAREVLLLSIPFLLNAVLYVYLTGAKRMVNANDTFGSYIAQYLSLSNAAYTDEAPLWLPNMAHGVASHSVLAFHGGGILHNILLPFSPLLKNLNFLPLFHWGMFAEEMVLFVGIWLLSIRYFQSPYSRFFVATAALGSSFWADQIYFNFRMLNALPFALWLIEGYFDDARLWRLLCAATLIVLQAVGSPSYIAFLMAVVAAMYAGLRFLLYRRESMDRIKNTRIAKSDPAWLLLLVLSLGAVYVTIFQAGDQFAIYSPGRTAEGKTSIDDFLTYGGPFHPLRYIQFLLGFSPPTDYSLFCGYLTAIFALVAPLYAPTRRVLHLTLCALIIGLFSFAHMGIVAPAAYSLVPGMSYFRHLWLVSPFVKVFAILLAGFTVDRLLLPTPAAKWPLRIGGLALAVIPAAFAFFLVWMTKSEAAGGGGGALSAAVSLRKLFVPDGFDPQVLSSLAESSVLSALLAAGVVYLCSMGRRHRPFALALVLILHPLDIFGWKFVNFYEKTFALNAEQYAMQEFQPPRFLPRRSGDHESNARFSAWPQSVLTHGTTYFTLDPYFGMDPPASRYRINYWMQPFDDLLRSFWGQPLRHREIWPKGLNNEQLLLPENPVLRKVIGLDGDKVQFFAAAHFFPSTGEAASALTDPRFHGDILIVTRGNESGESIPAPTSSPADLAADERLPLPYEVLGFSANHFALRVTVPPGVRDAWLAYSDVWHPDWTATVNGRPVPIERAFLAYKAIPLDPAGNDVEFRFYSPWRVRSLHALGLLSALVLGLTVWWTIKTVTTLSRTSAEHGPS